MIVLLLQTEQPDCCQDFDHVSNFIDGIFEYAASPNKRPFNIEDFKEHFGEAGAWFIKLSKSDKGPVRKGLLGLFSVSPFEVSILRKVFENDLTFHTSLDDQDFCFQVQCLPEKLLEILKDFIEPFYTQIFCQSSFKHITGLQNNGLNREIYLKYYKEKNQDRYQVCPVCLGDVQGYEETFIAQNEHYFPKQKYPSLGFSQHNLIPVCSDCNSPTIHGSKDPIAAHGPGAISNVFLPYYRTAMDSVITKFTKILGGFQVNICAVNQNDLILVERVNNLNRIYQLEKRWTARVSTHFDDVFARLKAHRENVESTEQDDVKRWLIQFLKSEEKWTRERRYNTADAFLQANFYKYLYEEYIDHLFAQLHII